MYDALAVETRQDELNGGNFNKVFFGGLAANWRPMAGKKDKARRYLRWAVLNERRAAEAYNGDLKTLFLEIAAQYRDLAEQIAYPELGPDCPYTLFRIFILHRSHAQMSKPTLGASASTSLQLLEARS